MPNNEPKKQENFNFKNFIQKNEIKPIKDGENKDAITTREDVTSVRGMEDLKKSDFEDYGNIYEGQDINKTRYENQSGLEQFGSWATQSAGEIVGGALSGFGATLDIPDAVISEMRDKDADFKNILTEAGDAITQWSKDAAPIYRKNPGKSFDVSDSGWWFENGVSVASTLSLLIPATGVVKGVSYVGKVLKLSDELALAGKLVKGADKVNKLAGRLEKAKHFAKIGVSAIVSRNAENFKESAQILTETKDNLLKEWDENPDKFNELLNSDVAKELESEGRPVDKENLSNFIASKAAWLSYGVNSLNIGFDALQLAPLFKGFKPVTQISKLETSIAIKRAQKEALGKTFTKANYLTSALNPLSSSIARNATEGIEEAINYVGTEEGKTYADQLTGKKTKDLSGRIGDYLVDPHMYESAVWGVLGGMAFGGAANGLGRVANLVKGKDGYGLKEARIDEINKRVSQIKETSEAIKEIENDPKLNDEEKSHYIANVKADAITKLTINAAQVGNYDMLREHLESPEMRKQMLEAGYATEGDVDKAVANSLLDATTAVEMYKSNYNLFQTRKIDDNVKNIQIAEKTYWDTVNRKHFEQKNSLLKDIQTLKSTDNYINTTKDENVNLTIELEALKQARKSIQNITENSNEPLSQYQKEILETADKRIESLSNNINKPASLSTLNPQILDKQIQVEQKNMIIEALGHKAKYMTTPEYSEKIKKETEEASKKRKEKDINDFKESIKNKTKEELETLKSTVKEKAKKDIIDNSIKNFVKEEEVNKRKEEVKKTKETATPSPVKETEPISVVSKPVKKRTDDAIFDMFDEDFETKEVDETKLNPEKKQLIDNALNTKDYGSLLRADSAYRGGVEQQYIRNKITEIKEGLLKEVEEAQNIANLNEVPVSNNINDSIDETNLFKLERPQQTEVNKKDNNGLLFAKKTTGSNNQESVRPLLDIFKLTGYNNEEQITEDDKGNLHTSKETEEAIKIAYDLKPGDTVTLKIDTTNALYERYKEDKNEVPIGIYKNNVRIGYIAGRKRSINTNEFDMITQFREHINLDLNKTLDVEITEKTNGDVINTKQWYSIKNMNLDNYEFYTVLNASSGHELERLSPDAAYHINENKPYGKVINTPEGKKNLRGVLYLMLHNVNGAPFPTPLSVSKLSDFDAAKVENNINKLLTLLDSGKGLETQEVQKIKDSISEYILVDDSRDVKREQELEKTKREAYLKFEKAETEEGKAKYAELKAEYDELQSKRKINFRVHAPSKTKPARIEMSYIAGDGTKRLVILNKDSINIKGQNGENLAYKKAVNGDFGKVFADQNTDSVLGKILKSKYYNVNFKKLREGNKEYKEQLIYNNVLRTNVGEITDSKGNVLSNFTNFSIRIATKKVEEKPIKNTTEIKEQKTDSKDNQELFGDLFNVKREAKELFFRDAKTNYRLYANNKSTANELIEDILKNPKSELIKKAAEFLKNGINNVNIAFKDIKETDTLAVYDSLNNIINVTNRNRFNSEAEFQESMLHEITHALTVLPLVKFKEFLGTKTNPDLTSYKFKETASKEVVDFVTKMETLRQDAINTINKRFPDVSTRKIEQTYGLTNVYEFISEVFVNEQFREAIKSDRNLFERILDSILEFLNKYLGTKKRDNNVDLATKEIIKFINSQKKDNYAKLIDGISPVLNSNYVEFRKLTDKKISDNFSSEEKNHLINFTKTATLHYFKGGKLEDTENKTEQTSSKEFVKSKIQLVLDKAVLNDNQKELLERSLEHFDTLWVETLSQVNRIFGTRIDENENDTLDTTETLELEKKWDDSVANATAMNDQLSKEVKWFIATTPQKDKEGNTVQNPVTGLPESVNYGSVINLMIKHLSSAQTELDLLNKLNTLKVVNPSFELMANKLKNDANLLAAFKSQFTRNILDSNILLISKMDEYIKAKVDNEFKKTKGYINIADNWIKIVNNNIDNGTYKSKTFKDLIAGINKDKLQFEKLRLEENYLSKDNKLTEKGNELVSLIFNYSNLLGINLDIPAIEDSVKSARTLNDVVILNKLNNIARTIEKDEKNNSNGDLNDIAKFQDKYDIEFAEIMALNLKGEPVYAAQLPSFLTNFFARLKSDNKEVKEKFEREFFEIVENDPVMQYSNWAWTEGKKLGLFNYVVVGNKKQPTSINSEFVSMWGIAKLGGSKNTISKETQDYTEFSDNDYKLTLSYMYLDNGNNKHCWIPTLIPSDSGNLPLLKVNRFQLKDKELSFTLNNNKVSNVQLSESSELFKAVQNATFQEIERMKQAYDLMFDVTSDSIKIKSQYYNEETNTLTEEGKKWFALLEKNYHYKKITYKKGTNEVDVKNTLLDKSGKPSGRVFEFHNVRLNTKTLSNKEAFKNPYNLVGTLSTSFIEKNINPFIQEYIANLINTELTSHSEIKNDGLIKKEAHAFIGDGSFEQFIAEMALNNYIHNVEQQVWFNGVSAQYKNNVDTNKRAKQMNAPGNAPTTAGATEYGAITIQDVTLKSKTFDTIKAQVEKQLLEEKGYKYKDNKELLEADTNLIIKDYNEINSGDAQGYITVKGLKELYEKYGMMNDTYIKIFKQIESGEQLSVQAIKTLQAVKPFHYGIGYNHALNKMTPNQIKLSYLPLIPQLIAGTDLEKIANHLDKVGATRLFFESAHKVGATQIYKIHNEDGNLNESFLEAAQPVFYKYSDEQIQLTVPDHLVDSTNLLATQIAKLIVANLSDSPIYNGKTGKEIKEQYFNLLVKNIEESKDKLLSDIRITMDENGNYKFEDNNALRELLLEEIASRGLGKNYEDAIALKEDGTFVLPLFTGKNADKWESILTSIFTNRIMKQKLPGASLTLASDLFTKQTKQEDSNLKGIEWQEGHNGELKSYTINEENNEVQVVEVVMGSWSKQFFKDGERISINKIPDDVRTMIGYRIPTQAKHSMVVFKVVGFLPEEAKGSIIMPNDIITQMGSDFDIDKLFVMYKNFTTDKEGNLTTNFKEVNARQIKHLKAKLEQLEKNKGLDEAATKLVNDIFTAYAEDFNPIETGYEYVKEKLNSLIKKVEHKDRQNELIDIYKTILTNPHHLKESFTPATFADFIKGKEILDRLFETSDDNIDILSPEGQRTFRKRNMAGRILKGISANFNSFLPVAQNTGMYLKPELGFKQKVRIKNSPINEYEKVYDLARLQEKYTNVVVEGDYAIVTLTKLGKADNESYMNIDDNIITEVASQGIGAAVDIVKDPTFDAFNATTYTYPQFNTGLAVGVNPMYMMFFTRQPIVKMLNDEYFNGKSLLGNNTGQERSYVRNVYESLLYNALIEKKQIKGKKVTNVKASPKRFNKEMRTKLFNYTLDDIKTFSDGELYRMLEQNKVGHAKLDLDEKIEYYKNQLYILNQFAKNYQAGDAVQDVLKSVKTDAHGAGPSMEKTVDLANLIFKSSKAEKILINEKSAVNSIYPKLFGSKEKSAYPVIEAYYENVNELSYKVLSPLFITQNNSFIQFKNTLKFNGLNTKNNIKVLKKFFNKALLEDFTLFNENEKHRVLGTSIYRENKPKFDGSIESFKELSTLDKLSIIKEITSSETIKGQASILNRLIPSDKFESLGYSKIEFNTNYKDTMLDDMFAEQLETFYNSGDEFKKEFVIDLLRYNYFANGMEYGFGSISKVFPPNVLIKEGIGEHLYSKNTSNYLFNINLDYFYRNNWMNNDIVPKVKTKFIKVNGEKEIEKNDDNIDIEENDKPVYKTYNNTPVWDANSNILIIPFNKLKNEAKNVKNSPYLVINKTTKEGESYINTPYLFKKVELEIEEGKEKETLVYYYKVNTLGKDSILEFSDKSIWLENNQVNEEKHYQDVMDKIFQIESNKAGLPNISQENIDNHNKECGGI